MFFSSFQFWDLVLLVVVTLQTTVHAYVSDAQMKVFVYLLPFHFSAAALAIGHPVGSANIWSLLLLVLYSHGVRLMHVNLRVPIHIAIGSTVLACAALGLSLTPALAFVQQEYSGA